jgi:tRNA G18 (ribose-2'-O)-methylase SpoU
MPKQLQHNAVLFEMKTFPIILVCDHIYFQDNIGSLFRISEAFGIEKIIFVGKDIPFNLRKINKTSRSTHLNVSYSVIEEIEKALDYLVKGDHEIISLEITDSSKPIKEIVIPVSKKIALIIGNEISGISDIFLAASNQIVHINMYGKNSSMNVVQATSIALYQITTPK